jgi:signal transduction histidine kinase
MSKEKIIWETVIFGTILLLALGTVLISFIFLYQQKKHRHQQEVLHIQETFNREMLHSKSEIQEQTLQHIASEIHDNFNPTLSVINLNLASVIPLVEDPAKETVTDTKMLVKQLMAEMKALSISLNTDHVSRIGFHRALEQYIERLRKTGFYSILFTSEGEPYRLSPNKEIILLRMCQEILNNIVKHADAKIISIKLSYAPQLYKIQIDDDGIGFEPDNILSNPQKQDSSGLRNLHNRAVAINAELSISSRPEKGTAITISINS